MLQDINGVDALAIQIKAANVRAVSRAITLLEDRQSDGLAILNALEPPSRHAAIIGVTGYPGAGKSTLIDQLITAYRQQGKTVGSPGDRYQQSPHRRGAAWRSHPDA